MERRHQPQQVVAVRYLGPAGGASHDGDEGGSSEAKVENFVGRQHVVWRLVVLVEGVAGEIEILVQRGCGAELRVAVEVNERGAGKVVEEGLLGRCGGGYE